MKITTAVSLQILIEFELVFGLSLVIVRTWLVYAVCSINHNTRQHIETIRYNYYWSQLWQVCYALCSAEAILAEQTHTNGPSCANGKAQVRGRIINNSLFELCINKKQTNIYFQLCIYKGFECSLYSIICSVVWQITNTNSQWHVISLDCLCLTRSFRHLIYAFPDSAG